MGNNITNNKDEFEYKKFQSVFGLPSDKTDGIISNSFQPEICIVTPDIYGLIKNGGIGTSFYHSAIYFKKIGFSVSVIFTLSFDHITDDDVKHANQFYKEKEINLFFLYNEMKEEISTPSHPSEGPPKESYCIYKWLKKKSFDIAFFPDWRGLGFYSAHARRQGLLPKTAVIIQAHSSSLWHALNDRTTDFSLEILRVFHMEREAVRLADAIVSPTRYLLDWKRQHGFVLPENTFVQPYILNWEKPNPVPDVTAVNEFVFFGRLEERKGLSLFCDGLDRFFNSAPSLPKEFKITFLGKFGQTSGEHSLSYLLRRVTKWPVMPEFISNFDAGQALEYLKGGTKLAFVCSRADNSPLTVLECLYNGIPFVAAATGGVPELIRQEDLPMATFAPNAKALFQKMVVALAQGTRVARPRGDIDRINAEWCDAFRTMAWTARRHPAGVAIHTGAPTAGNPPLLTVCVTHFNRRHYLEQTLHGLKNQTFKNFEVILCDDGSTNQEDINYIRSLADDFNSRGWMILRQENAYVGAARNTAARHAQGKYLVFMDDDNYADPFQLETFVLAAETSGAAVLTCVANAFIGSDRPDAGMPIQHRYLPLGGGISINLFENFLGDANCIVRRSSFEEVGGFSEDYGVSWEDYELLMKFVVEGYEVGVIPEPLFWLRTTPGSVSRTSLLVDNSYRALRPLLSRLPWGGVGDAMLHLFGQILSSRLIQGTESGSVSGAGAAMLPYGSDAAAIGSFARYMVANGQTDMAVSMLKTATIADPAVWLVLADVLRRQGKFDAAAQAIMNVNGRLVDPAAWSSVYVTAARITFAQSSELAQTLQHYRMAVSRNPRNITAHLERAHAAAFSGEFAEALMGLWSAARIFSYGYFSLNPDLLPVFRESPVIDAIWHYRHHGIAERRRAPALEIDLVLPSRRNPCDGRMETTVADRAIGSLLAHDCFGAMMEGYIAFEELEGLYFTQDPDARAEMAAADLACGLVFYLGRGKAQGRPAYPVVALTISIDQAESEEF